MTHCLGKTATCTPTHQTFQLQYCAHFLIYNHLYVVRYINRVTSETESWLEHQERKQNFL